MYMQTLYLRVRRWKTHWGQEVIFLPLCNNNCFTEWNCVPVSQFSHLPLNIQKDNVKMKIEDVPIKIGIKIAMGEKKKKKKRLPWEGATFVSLSALTPKSIDLS